MKLVRESSRELGLYLLNSVNPWRIEGQKTIMFELIQQLGWESPDWIVVPAGNLGNTSAFGKALYELREVGLIENVPKIAAIQAEGANPFYMTWKKKSKKLLKVEKPDTIASAIKIGNPVSWRKALRALEWTKGVVEQVSDQEIMDAKAVVDSSGVGCEPASAASLAGARKLAEHGVIEKDEKVVCVLTGHILKDPEATVNYHTKGISGLKQNYANKPKTVKASLDSVKAAL